MQTAIHATRAITLVLLTALVGVLACEDAAAAPADGMSAKRLVLKNPGGTVVLTFREKTPGKWEKRSPGRPWQPVQLIDQSEHVLWFFDTNANEELRVGFPGLLVRRRPGSNRFPNPNPWSATTYKASAFTTALAPGESQGPATGMTVTRFVLRSRTGGEVATYRERRPATTPATWESKMPGMRWRGPIRIVDRSKHVLWLFDEMDNTELRLQFPGLTVQTRPGSQRFPNPARWSTLPVRVDELPAVSTPNQPQPPTPQPPVRQPQPQPSQRLTFKVRNDSGEIVELFQPSNWPPVHGVGSLIDVIRVGQTGNYTGRANLGWVVRRAAAGKAEMQRFIVSQNNQLVVVARVGPPPRPRETLHVVREVGLFGGWPHIGGDMEMDTGGSDRVPVVVKTRLHQAPDKITVQVYFRCEEYGGDHTAYGGTWRQVALFSPGDGTIPAGAKFVGIRAVGGLEATWNYVSVGKKHGLQQLNTSGTYWSTISVRVDAPGRLDEGKVGMRGTISISVVIER